MKEVVERLRREVQGPVAEGVPTGRYTTVGIGGPADIFVEATCRDDVAAVCRIAFETGTPMRVLGPGPTCSYRTGACAGSSCTWEDGFGTSGSMGRESSPKREPHCRVSRSKQPRGACQASSLAAAFPAPSAAPW